MASPSIDAPTCSCCGAAMQEGKRRGECVWCCHCGKPWTDLLARQSTKLGRAIEAYLRAESAAKRKKASNEPC